MNQAVWINEAPAQADGLLSEQTVDGVIIVSPTTGRLRVLNPLGSSIWSLLDGSRTVEDIENALQQQFPHISPAKIRGDLIGFLSELMNRGLISGIEY